MCEFIWGNSYGYVGNSYGHVGNSYGHGLYPEIKPVVKHRYNLHV